MGLPELFLEHKRGEKRQKVLRIKPHAKLFVIGSSKQADLCIRGEGVTGCHAALRLRGEDWYICDISGTESVKVNGVVVAEAKLDGSAKIEIAGHSISLFSKQVDHQIFIAPETSATPETTGPLTSHQVVVRAKGHVVETHLLGLDDEFVYFDGEREISLPPPTDGNWKNTEVGTRTVQQRLVGSQEVLAADKFTFDREMRKSLVLALLLLLCLVSSIFFLHPEMGKHPEMALDNKSLDIIYNAKAIKLKKVESQKVVKAAAARAGGSSEQAPQTEARNTMPEESQAPKPSKTSAALNSLRQSGLANLVGKIAKRANKQGVMVAAMGVSPDTIGAGRAFYNTGTSTSGGGGGASKAGPTYRLGGVATRGKAGGVGSFKEGTALSGGNVGSGDIVAMVDEETVIEGGLDRDAIAEVIRRNLGQIRYCYERQLSSNPDLYGKVMMKFTIGPGGEVSEQHVDNSTLKSAMVEGCIARRMASWKFPEPKGGTQVHVSYPFLFKAN